jgi:hypothetical protein
MSHSRLPLLLALPLLLLAACDHRADRVPLEAEVPLHLEEHLADARVEGSEVPKELPEAAEWRFDKPQAEWKAVVPLVPGVGPVEVEQAKGALRVGLTESTRQRRGLRGGIYIDVPDWNREDWVYAVVRARSSEEMGNLALAFNLRPEHGEYMFEYEPFAHRGDSAPLINDGAAHDYLLRADWSDIGSMKEPVRQLGLVLNAQAPASI